MYTHYERSIDVAVPVHEAWAAWSRVRDFPDFVSELDAVDVVAPDVSEWHARLAGARCAWTAEITERIPGRRIAWRSRSGPPHAGCVTFHPLGTHRTRLMLQVDYRPAGLLASAGDILRVPQRCLDAALDGFKRHVEHGDAPTLQARNAGRAPRLDRQPEASASAPLG